MSKEIIIRPAKPDDTNIIVEFNCAMAYETEQINLISEVIHKGVKNLLHDESSGFYVLAENNGEVIGSLMITTEWSDWRNGFFWWVQSVYVLPAHRQQGVYRRLYQHVQDLANKRTDVVGFRLYVEKGNTRAQKTYSKLGMKETHYLMYEELSDNIRFFTEEA